MTDKITFNLKPGTACTWEPTQSDLREWIGAECTIVRPLTREEADSEVGPMYRVRVLEGQEFDAFEDELSEIVAAKLPVVDGDQNADVYGYAKDAAEAAKIASDRFADDIVYVDRYGPINLRDGRVLPEAFVAFTADPEAPYCDMGCGDRATVRFQDVGACDDCAEAMLRDTLRNLCGDICANVSRRTNGHVTVCLAPYGIEHDHD